MKERWAKGDELRLASFNSRPLYSQEPEGSRRIRYQSMTFLLRVLFVLKCARKESLKCSSIDPVTKAVKLVSARALSPVFLESNGIKLKKAFR